MLSRSENKSKMNDNTRGSKPEAVNKCSKHERLREAAGISHV
jgi:hypothetical protein